MLAHFKGRAALIFMGNNESKKTSTFHFKTPPISTNLKNFGT